MTDITKTRRTKYRIANLAHLLLQLGPIIYFLILGLCSIETAAGGATFTFLTIISIGLSVAAAVKGKMSRSSLWLALIAMYVVLDYIMVPLVIIASCQVVDELAARPIRNRLHRKYEHGRDTDEYLNQLNT